MKRKPLSNEEHSQSSQTPHLTTATSSDARAQIHTQILMRDQAVVPYRMTAETDLAPWIDFMHFMDKLCSDCQLINTLLSSAGFRSNDEGRCIANTLDICFNRLECKIINDRHDQERHLQKTFNNH